MVDILKYDSQTWNEVRDAYKLKPTARTAPFYAVSGSTIITDSARVRPDIIEHLAREMNATISSATVDSQVELKMRELSTYPHDTYQSYMRWIGTKLYIDQMKGDRYSAMDVRDASVADIFNGDHVFDAEDTLKAIYQELGTLKSNSEIERLVEKYRSGGDLALMFHILYKKWIDPDHQIIRNDQVFAFL